MRPHQTRGKEKPLAITALDCYMFIFFFYNSIALFSIPLYCFHWYLLVFKNCYNYIFHSLFDNYCFVILYILSVTHICIFFFATDNLRRFFNSKIIVRPFYSRTEYVRHFTFTYFSPFRYPEFNIWPRGFENLRSCFAGYHRLSM